jgi:hypothetical protein
MEFMSELPIHSATRYVQPLREGGSLPAVVDTEAGLFVVKFRGAGQGVKVLVAELIVGRIASRLGLPVPELALIEVAPLFGRTEPDPEIQDILRASHGLNVGLRYLDGAFNYDEHAAGELIDPELAAAVVWLDAFLTNPDRTHRNPNLLLWQRRPWLIDHGAALYAHHDWSGVDEARTRTRFPLIEKHVLLARSGDLAAADAHLAPRLGAELFGEVLATIPDELLLDPHGREPSGSADEARARYVRYLATRLEAPRDFVAEAVRAREARLREPPRRLEARR